MTFRSLLRRTVALTGLLALPLGVHAAPMQPGLWEMAMTLTLGGKTETVPAGRACISQRDVDDATKTLPRPAGVCSLTNVQRTTDRATYDLFCQDQQVRMQGRADIALNGDRYDGKVDMMMLGTSNTGMPVTMAINARRLGDCTP